MIEFSDHVEYCAGLVKAYLTCDQRCAFSENIRANVNFCYHLFF